MSLRPFFALTAAFLAFPVSASGIDCSQPHDPTVRTICAHPKVLALDAQLSSEYTAALARDPSHATELQQDEINWLGERNRDMWWLLASHREFPSLPSNLETGLAKFYRLRIAFLHDIANPAATRHMPIAQKLLESLATLPSSATDPLEALQSAGIVVLAKEHDATDVEHTIATLAAPPNAALREALDHFTPYTYTVEYLPSAGLGGAFNIEGTAYCQYWVIFEKQGDATVPVSVGKGNSLGGCMRDAGSTGYIALINGHPVELTVTNDPYFWNITDFQWRQWLGAGKWGPERRIRLRYGYILKSEKKVYCPSRAPECISTPTIALNTARHYMSNALTLDSLGDEMTPERARTRQMLNLAPDHKSWGNCMYPVWFTAHLDGKLAVGGITESHFACHPNGNSLDVGLWGMQSNEVTWWFADNTVDVERQGLLSAAVIPPQKSSE